MRLVGSSGHQPAPGIAISTHACVCTSTSSALRRLGSWLSGREQVAADVARGHAHAAAQRDQVVREVLAHAAPRALQLARRRSRCASSPARTGSCGARARTARCRARTRRRRRPAIDVARLARMMLSPKSTCALGTRYSQCSAREARRPSASRARSAARSATRPLIATRISAATSSARCGCATPNRSTRVPK